MVPVGLVAKMTLNQGIVDINMEGSLIAKVQSYDEALLCKWDILLPLVKVPKSDQSHLNKVMSQGNIDFIYVRQKYI